MNIKRCKIKPNKGLKSKVIWCGPSVRKGEKRATQNKEGGDDGFGKRNG